MKEILQRRSLKADLNYWKNMNHLIMLTKLLGQKLVCVLWNRGYKNWNQIMKEKSTGR